MNTQIKNFSDLGIVAEYKSFTGKKISVSQILNLRIKVFDFKIEDSKRKPGTKLLTLDFELDGERKIVFTSAVILQQVLLKVPASEFPFNATIVLKDQHLEFI